MSKLRAHRCVQAYPVVCPDARGLTASSPLRVVNIHSDPQLHTMKDMVSILRVFAPLFLTFCYSLPGRDYGPPVGGRMAGFELHDQNGKLHDLGSLLGPKGAILVFYRSADW
jgi:hypothetical protein